MTNAVNNRYDFVLLFDVQDGNPNGDPDAGNLPRVDPETGHGLVTDVCLKRKVRNYVGIVKKEIPPFEIYVKEKAILNAQQDRAYQQPEIIDLAKENKVERARLWMCHNFYDVRTFGAVMSTGDSRCGQVRGPVQLTFARSIDQVIPLEHSITRMAVTTKKEAEEQKGDNRTMGRKYTIPYALYRCQGFISAHLANQVGFSSEDLALFWEALQNMFEHDHSASRGYMATRGLYIFKHENSLGKAPAHQLFDRISVARRAEIAVPRHFTDYLVTVNDTGLKKGNEQGNGVELEVKAG